MPLADQEVYIYDELRKNHPADKATNPAISNVREIHSRYYLTDNMDDFILLVADPQYELVDNVPTLQFFYIKVDYVVDNQVKETLFDNRKSSN